MNQQEARVAITKEHFRGYKDRNGDWIPAVWELRTPDGWCWEPGRHLNCCFTSMQAKKEQKSEPIYPCEPNCEACGTENEEEDNG